MKRFSKRLVSLMLALIMTLSMAVNVFAAGDSSGVTVNIVFQMEGEDIGLGGSFTIPAEFVRLYSVPDATDDTSLILQGSTPSVMDATLLYLDSIGCYDAEENALTWFREPIQNEDGSWYVKNWGGLIQSMFATPQEQTNDPSDLEWWKGNAWRYSINDEEESEKFATNVAATDGMTIIWNYRYVEERY